MSKWYAVARACPRLRRKNKLTLTVYVFRKDGSDRLYWGLGCYADAQEMLAEAVIRICEMDAIDDIEGSVIKTTAPGITLYRDVHVWNWREDGKIDERINAVPWKRFQELAYLQKVKIEQATGKDDMLALRPLQHKAAELECGLGRKMVREQPALLARRGVFCTEENAPGAINSPWGK